MHDAAFSHDHEELHRRAVDMDGLEKLTLTTVGIDIGSSTTHLLFSRLTLRREGARHSAKFTVSDRQIIWASPILLTPYLSRTVIDFEQIKEFIHNSYHSAGVSRADIDTGAVVITGEALKKENARPIIEYFAHDSGTFICASAGPHHEALLAAYGSGAVRLSKVSTSRILNVDIGGGTTKLSLIVDGEIVQTAALNIGARLLAFDQELRVTRIEDAGRFFANKAGVSIDVGDQVEPETLDRIGVLMGQTLIDVFRTSGGANVARELRVTAPLEAFDGIHNVDYLVISGGVSEYVYSNTEHSFGDLGPALGRTLRTYFNTLPSGTLLRPAQGIRATVIGASEYTVQVSGATSYFTSTDNLPLFGYKVIRVKHSERNRFSQNLSDALRKFDLDCYGPRLVVALSVTGPLDYEVLQEVANGLAELAQGAPECPLLVVIEQDIARAIGNILTNEMKLVNPLICIDGIAVGDLDYIDIGRPMSVMDVFPVTVKSLLFTAERSP